MGKGGNLLGKALERIREDARRGTDIRIQGWLQRALDLEDARAPGRRPRCCRSRFVQSALGSCCCLAHRRANTWCESWLRRRWRRAAPGRQALREKMSDPILQGA